MSHYYHYHLGLLDLGKKSRAEVHSGKYDSAVFEGSGNASFGRIERERFRWRTFTEKSYERWSQYVCVVCKHLVFRRDMSTWVCGKGHSITKEDCVDFVDDFLHVRFRMPDGQFMYVGEL